MRRQRLIGWSVLLLLVLACLIYKLLFVWRIDESISHAGDFSALTFYSDMNRSSSDFSCPMSSYWPLKEFPICVYAAAEDRFFSAPLLLRKFKSNSDSTILNMFVKELLNDSDIAFIDIGANLGIYTLPTGYLKHNQVIAIEVNIDTIARLAKSVSLGKLENYVTLLHNAVSDKHHLLSLDIDSSNRGDVRVKEINDSCNQGRSCPKSRLVKTITLDDILPIMKTSKAVIKVDVQGHETHVFSKEAEQFFKKIDVKTIVLEWVLIKEFVMNGKLRNVDISEWVNTFFYRQNYIPYHPLTLQKLDQVWQNWPYDVMFKRDSK
jgi:FkbM family methyltransferase